MRIRSISMAVLIILICLSLVACSFPITKAGARAKANSDFTENKEAFAQVVNAANLHGNILSATLGIGTIQDIAVPDELAAAGINAIYADVNDQMIYFEYAEPIMWTTAFGILYAADDPSLPEWYRLEPIKDHWYFFRIVS